MPKSSPLPSGLTVKHPKIEMEVTHYGTSESLSPLAPGQGGNVSHPAFMSGSILFRQELVATVSDLLTVGSSSFQRAHGQ